MENAQLFTVSQRRDDYALRSIISLAPDDTANLTLSSKRLWKTLRELGGAPAEVWDATSNFDAPVTEPSAVARDA